MREAGTQAPEPQRIVDDLRGAEIAVVVYAPGLAGHVLVRLNRSLLSSNQNMERVLLWARREIAQGKRLSWLLADDMADLP
jgi:hypothetical protein